MVIGISLNPKFTIGAVSIDDVIHSIIAHLATPAGGNQLLADSLRLSAVS
jgi:hypothetical protein